MADSKISALPASTTPLAGTEVLPIVQSSTTKQVSVANLTAGRAVSALSLTSTTTLGVTGTSTLSGNAIISVTDNTNAALRITQLGTGNALLVEDTTNPDASPFVIDSGGAVGLGTATPSGFVSSGGFVQTSSSGYNPTFMQVNSASDNSGAYLSQRKNRASAIVSNGDALGNYSFEGYNGASYNAAASIVAAVDGTPGTNDMPGRLVFSTTADGASSPTERMRIDSSGNVGIGTTSPSGKLQVQQTTDGTLLRLQRTGGSNVPILKVNLTESTNLVEFEATGATGASITFNVGAVERLQISSAGTVSIPGTLSIAAYTETIVASSTVGSTATLAITAGTVLTATLTASTPCTFTMPTGVAGKSFILRLTQAATGMTTATFTGVKWPGGTAPTITATASAVDIISFVYIGTSWYGNAAQAFA